MNQELAEVVKLYATKSHKQLLIYLAEKSKDSLTATLLDLLTVYFNDKNSSTLRQYLIVTLSGFEPNHAKIGYDGYKQVAVDGSLPEYAEAKPKNINTHDPKPKKLDGTANFTDYTWARLNKDIKANPIMIMGGFIDGKLIYIMRFPFNSLDFISRLKAQLQKSFPDGDRPGFFLRSATFGLSHYKDLPNLEVDFFVNRAMLEAHKSHITRGLYETLMARVGK